MQSIVLPGAVSTFSSIHTADRPSKLPISSAFTSGLPMNGASHRCQLGICPSNQFVEYWQAGLFMKFEMWRGARV
ncbi:hypothetical protein GCM10027159_31190 [Lysobacter terrae]